MKSFDIIAWHYNGASYCPDCKPEGTREEPGPVFATDLESENGATCDNCGCCLIDGDWLDFQEATAKQWWRCDGCGTQSPHDSSHVPDDQETIPCPNCLSGLQSRILL